MDSCKFFFMVFCLNPVRFERLESSRWTAKGLRETTAGVTPEGLFEKLGFEKRRSQRHKEVAPFPGGSRHAKYFRLLAPVATKVFQTCSQVQGNH